MSDNIVQELRTAASGPGRIFILRRSPNGEYKYQYGCLGGNSSGPINIENAASRLMNDFCLTDYLPKIKDLGWTDLELKIRQMIQEHRDKEEAKKKVELQAQRERMISDFGKFDGWTHSQFQQEAIRLCYHDADSAFFGGEEFNWRFVREQTFTLMSYAKQVKALELEISVAQSKTNKEL